MQAGVEEEGFVSSFLSDSFCFSCFSSFFSASPPLCPSICPRSCFGEITSLTSFLRSFESGLVLRHAAHNPGFPTVGIALLAHLSPLLNISAKCRHQGLWGGCVWGSSIAVLRIIDRSCDLADYLPSTWRRLAEQQPALRHHRAPCSLFNGT